MKNNYRNYRKKTKKNSIIIDKPLPAKRLRLIISFSIGIFVLLILRLFWIQFIKGSWLKEKAYRQQTSSTIISPERGSILDVNGKKLATSEKLIQSL